MEEERIPQRKKKKRRNYGNRLAFVIVGAVIIAYVFFEIFSAYFGGLETEPAVQVSVNDSFNAVGWFFRDEAPIEGRTGESAKHIVYSGERVQKDAPLATIYADEAALAISRQLEPLENKIELLDAALQSSNDEADSAKIDQLITLALQQMAGQVRSGSGISLSASADSLRTLSLRRESGHIDTAAITAERDALAAERDSLNAQLSGRTSQLTAPFSGYFSDNVDGYEQTLTPEALDELTIDTFHELTQQGKAQADSSSMGKIIQGFSWYLVSEVSTEDANRLTEGQNLRVNFTQASMEAPVSVYSIIKEHNSETALVVLEGTSFDSEMVSMRNQPIEIIIATYTGLRVPKQAVRMDGNEIGVYILSGSVEKFKTIHKLYETDSYYVVEQSATDAGALVAKDQIIVRGKNLQNNMVVRT